MTGVMVTKAVLLSLSVVALFNIPVCCCFGPREPVESKDHDRSCSHCPKKPSPSPSVPHSKQCGCDHGLREVSADLARPSLVLPGGPDSEELLLPPLVVVPNEAPEIALLLLGRGPPPPRVNLPLYLLVRHLLV